MRLRGKVAVVTGGASGIGRATAEQAAREGAREVFGNVAVAGSQGVAAAIGASSGVALAVMMDAGRLEDHQRLVASAVSTFGGVDIVHANAAYPCGFQPAAENADEAWMRALGGALPGAFWCVRDALHTVDGGWTLG